MTATDDRKAMHANVEKWGIELPAGPHWAEDRLLTPEESHIPVERYLSKDELDKELKYIWYRTWQMACREDEVSKPGDYYEYVIARQSFLIVRGDDGILRAFHNVCKHRGNQIANGQGNASSFICSFHAWCYALTGKLTYVPDVEHFTDFDAEKLGMDEVKVESFGGWVFIHPKPAEAQPLTEFLGPLVDQLTPYNVDRMRTTLHAVLEVDANWKVALEAFLEVYHLFQTHPQIMSYVDDVNTPYEVIGDHDRMIVPFGVPSMRYEHITPETTYGDFYKPRPSAPGAAAPVLELSSDLFDENGKWISPNTVREVIIQNNYKNGVTFGHDYSGLTHSQMVDDWDYRIFPGMKFNQHAGSTLAFRSRPHATDPGKCIFDVWTLLWGNENEGLFESAPEVKKVIGVDSLGLVLDQDFSNIPKVQRGLNSSNLEHTNMGAQEIRVSHFQQIVQKYIREGRSKDNQ
jgi:choline monooxygenase